MVYLLQTLWLPLLLSGLIGLIIGLSTCGREPSNDKVLSGWVPLGAAAFATGIFASLTRLIYGQAGFWLDAALLIFGTYILGCCIGCVLYRLFGDHTQNRLQDQLAVAMPSSTGWKPKIEGASEFEGAQPSGLEQPRGGKGDDLKLINGVGRVLEKRLNDIGVWHFDQIATMNEAELKWISSYIGFPGRAIRENWADESKILASGGETSHSKSVKHGKVPTSL